MKTARHYTPDRLVANCKDRRATDFNDYSSFTKG